MTRGTKETTVWTKIMATACDHLPLYNLWLDSFLMNSICVYTVGLHVLVVCCLLFLFLVDVVTTQWEWIEM